MPKEIAVRKTTLVLGLLSFLFFFDSQKAWSQSGLTKVKITSPSSKHRLFGHLRGHGQRIFP